MGLCLASSSIIERRFHLFSPSDSLCALCRVSPTILIYSLFSFTNSLYSAFKEAETENVLAVDFSFSAHATITLVCASDLAWPKSPPSLKVAFFQFLNPSSDVNTESPEEGRLKCRQA